MTLRAGTYDAAIPQRRGVIRNDGGPWWTCLHNHASWPEAKDCARAALLFIQSNNPKATGSHPDPDGVKLPHGWTTVTRQDYARS